MNGVRNGKFFSMSKEKTASLLVVLFTLKSIKLWTKKFKGPYVITDKLDGISALVVYDITDNNITRSLYKRGTGTIGTDISYLLNYIQILKLTLI